MELNSTCTAPSTQSISCAAVLPEQVVPALAVNRGKTHTAIQVGRGHPFLSLDCWLKKTER